jgi:hypothetical protein
MWWFMTTLHQEKSEGKQVDLRLVYNPKGRFIDQRGQRLDIVWLDFDPECDISIYVIAELEYQSLQDRHNLLETGRDMSHDPKIELHTVHDPRVGVERRRAVMWSMYYLGYRTTTWNCPTGVQTNPAREVQEYYSSEAIAS